MRKGSFVGLMLWACGSGGSPSSPSDAGVDAIAIPDASADATSDAQDDAPDAAGVVVPAHARVELIATSPARVLTPPAWNAHSPKLAGDGAFLYAVHTYFTDDVSTRYAAILRRAASTPVGSGAWAEVARVVYPHQPPGVVIDATASHAMHMVFDCLRPMAGGADVTCFQGGAGTSGLDSRFYHLVFPSRDAGGALRFDTYTNANEWTATSNGYTGIGTTSDGVTYWSLADASYNRVVAWSGGTIATLTAPSAYLLYPIHASSPARGSKELVLYAGDFDPGGGNNASYLASSAYSGDTSSLKLLFRRAPPAPEPGTVAAFPSDVAYAPDGTLFALSYLPKPDGTCTELLRFDGGLGGPPAILPVGCQSDYAKIQFSRAGALYLITPASNGASLKLGVSADRGASFAWSTVTLDGVPASSGDASFAGFTPMKPYTSPAAYDPDRILFFFYGADAASGVAHSYLGEIDLANVR